MGFLLVGKLFAYHFLKLFDSGQAKHLLVLGQVDHVLSLVFQHNHGLFEYGDCVALLYTGYQLSVIHPSLCSASSYLQLLVEILVAFCCRL